MWFTRTNHHRSAFKGGALSDTKKLNLQVSLASVQSETLLVQDAAAAAHLELLFKSQESFSVRAHFTSSFNFQIFLMQKRFAPSQRTLDRLTPKRI